MLCDETEEEVPGASFAAEAPEPKQPEWRQRPYAAYETVEQWRKEEGVSWNRRRVPLCGTAETYQYSIAAVVLVGVESRTDSDSKIFG